MKFYFYFIKIFILFGFFIRNAYAPSISIALRFKNRGDGKVMTMMVTDRMVSRANTKLYDNFLEEWQRQYREGNMQGDILDRNIAFMFDTDRTLTLKQREFEQGMEGTPPKVQLAGRRKNPFGIALTGNAETLETFAGELRRDRLHKTNKYNSMMDVAIGLDRAHRETLANGYGADEKEQVHFGVKGEDLYSARVGRNIRIGNQRFPSSVQVRNLKGHLYSAGWNEAAMHYLERHFGRANQMDDLRTPWRDTIPALSLDEAKQHVRNAMRLNARDSAERGAFSVTENFDSYIFRKGKKPVYWEHEPEFEPMIRNRLEMTSTPVDMAKKLLDNGMWIDDIPGRFKLREEQKEWKRLAMWQQKKEEMERRGRHGSGSSRAGARMRSRSGDRKPPMGGGKPPPKPPRGVPRG